MATEIRGVADKCNAALIRLGVMGPPAVRASLNDCLSTLVCARFGYLFANH